MILQFFFVTLASAERRAVFSRLVSESGRPELLDIGELARAALRAVHRVWPAVTVSDYVIMPDHLHFQLIVNYDCDKSVSPLFIAHRVADAVEMAVARSLERTGARDCYIELSFDARQLKAIRHYIKLNPARALRETFAIYPAGALRPLSRRQSRNRRWAAANSLVLSRHSWNFLARHEAQPRRRASFSAELPRHERHRGAALRSLTRPCPLLLLFGIGDCAQANAAIRARSLAPKDSLASYGRNARRELLWPFPRLEI